MKAFKEKLDALDKHMSILLIDDDSTILQMLGFILGKMKFERIEKQTNLESAFKFLKRNEVHTIFLDINLGEDCGIQAIREIKEINSNAKIIMLSGNATMENVNASIEAGASGFISKPFNAKKIVHAMSTVQKTLKLQEKAEELKK